jgi:membrane protein involved in colicin uptake
MDSKNEKISELEEQINAFQAADDKRKADARAAEDKLIKDRLDKMEAEKAAMQADFDKKLDDIQMRASTANNAPDSKGLTKEEYEKNKEYYDTMYLKSSLPDVFN